MHSFQPTSCPSLNLSFHFWNFWSNLFWGGVSGGPEVEGNQSRQLLSWALRAGNSPLATLCKGSKACPTRSEKVTPWPERFIQRWGCIFFPIPKKHGGKGPFQSGFSMEEMPEFGMALGEILSPEKVGGKFGVKFKIWSRKLGNGKIVMYMIGNVDFIFGLPNEPRMISHTLSHGYVKTCCFHQMTETKSHLYTVPKQGILT